ncbi:MAG: hypothetical protein K2K89_01360 [Ruminococcus sp.]|nr:hypothetical protein [Ruminococcus sp.]
MEYYDIIFNGISSTNINRFIKEILDIKQDNIISSHFWSKESGDYEFLDNMDLCEYFSKNNTADIFAETIRLNCIYNKVVCVITSDDNDIEVDCNIAETDFDEADISELAKWLRGLCSESIITNAKICYDAENSPLFELFKGE